MMALLLVGAGCASSGQTPAGAWIAPTAVPAALSVPTGQHVVAHFHAVGAQVYACGPSTDAPAGFAWTLKRPDAELHDEGGAVVGTHGAGPTWTAHDGSSVVGKKVAQADAPEADAVPWLLVQAVSNSGDGILAHVTYVQRIATAHGKAPPSGCDTASVGTETRSSYTAEYYFYAAAP